MPWPERVKRSIEKFENDREDTRREQQVIGKIYLYTFTKVSLKDYKLVPGSAI